MPQVTRRLKLNRFANRWEPRNFTARGDGPPGAFIFAICNDWLRKRYVLDNSKPIYIVLSDDMEAKDTYLVDDVGARETQDYDVGSNHYLQVFSPGGKRGYSTLVAGNLREFVQVLKKRWKVDRVAIWFEQL